MKKIIFIIILVLCYSASGQSLSLFDVDLTGFPIMKVKFFAYDASGNQITNISSSDMEIMENGLPRNIIQVTCPTPKPPQALSSVLVMDVSGSMKNSGLDIAKAAANAWIELIPLGKSDCAITSFNEFNYINQDFTINKDKLINGINSLSSSGGTDYEIAFLELPAGGIPVAKTGKNKRVIVFLSDGQPNFEPNKTQIISEAIANNIIIYIVIIGDDNFTYLKEIANQTGGTFFEKINTKEKAEECYHNIFSLAEGNNPCEIEWRSEMSCINEVKNLEFKLLSYNISTNYSYNTSYNSVAKLDFNPLSIKFINAVPGIKKDTIVSLKARNADFNITNILCSNPAFIISPTNFKLKAGESKNLTVSFIPVDSGYIYCKFTFENDICPTVFYSSGGFLGKKPTVKTLKIIQPNGNEEFIVGMDTLISWDGILPEEIVKIEYSTNNGSNWININNSATGLSYNWRVPKTPSNQCLARITAKEPFSPYCNGGEVLICNKIWTVCNLNEDKYRNGDPIRHATTDTEWQDASNKKEGAWCFYDNNSDYGPIYGRLYNWYAVNDSRGLAPVGWHIPDSEWKDLSNCLSPSSVVGGKMKSTGTLEDGDGLWNIPNNGATNESGFSAIPGGNRNIDGKFEFMGSYGFWWSYLETDVNEAGGRNLFKDNAYLYGNRHNKGFGFSVRLVKD